MNALSTERHLSYPCHPCNPWFLLRALRGILQGLRSAFGILNSPPTAVGGYGIFVTRHSLIRVDSARTMRIPRIFTAAMLASALAQAEPLSPRVAERYRQMLAENPTESMALDRLWKGALDGGTTEELLAAYAKAEDFSGRMIFGLLLRKAGRDEDARAAFESAAKANAANPLPLLALARMENDGARPAKSAALFERALEAFLSVSPIAAERDAAFALWEKADNAARR